MQAQQDLLVVLMTLGHWSLELDTPPSTARDFYEQALSIAKSLVGTTGTSQTKLNLARVQERLAWISILENDKDTARDLYKEAEELFEGIVTTGDSHVEEAKELLVDLRELVSIWLQ